MDPAADPAPGTLIDRRIRPPARTAALLGLLVLVALVIRIDALRNVAPEVPEFGDARAYHLLGANLADGRGMVRPYDLLLAGEEIPTAEYPPGLPVLLAGADRIGIDSTTGQRALLCVVGSLTVGLVGLLGRRLGGDGAGYLAAALAAVYPALWGADVSLMAEPLAAFFGAAVLLAALAVVDRPSGWTWAALGATAGLGCLVRSEFALVGPILVGALAWHEHRSGVTGSGPVPWRPILTRAGVALGALVLVLVPWTIRNALAFDAFVPLSNNAGSVARGANCDAAYSGPFRGLWVTDVSLEGTGGADDRAGCFSGFPLDGQNEAEASAELRADGTAYLRDHLGEVPGVVAARVGRTVGLYRFDQQANFAAAEGRDPTWERRGTRMFQGLALLGAVGLLVAWRRRTLTFERLLLLVPPAVALVTVAVTYGNPRFRAVAEPAIVVLGALGLVDLFGQQGVLVRSVRRAWSQS